MYVDELSAACLTAMHGQQVLAGLQRRAAGFVQGHDLVLRDKSGERRHALAVEIDLSVLIVMDQQRGLRR